MYFLLGVLFYQLIKHFVIGYINYSKENPIPKREFSTKHATYEKDNVYVEGIGWCKQHD